MEYDYKIVRFDLYCNSCKYKKTEMNMEPCNECLTHPTNLHSQKPVKYEFDETKKKKGFTFAKLRRYTFEKLKKFNFGRLRGDK